MAPRPWTSDVQMAWLRARLPQFIEAQNLKKIPDFWPMVEAAWFEEFPEKKSLFGADAPEKNSDLTKEQRKELGKAIASRKKVRIICILSWHCD